MGIEPEREELLPSDRELVFSWKAGSLSAFESLVRRYQPRILAFLERRLGSRQDAEDVTQRVFVTIHQEVDRYREEHSFSTWVFLIARRQAIDLQRRSGARNRMRDQVASYAGPEASEDENPADALDQRERAARIWRWARQHLSEQACTALWLQVQEDMSDTEIAQVMKLTRTHVRVILHRARRRLIALRSRAESPPFKNDPGIRSKPSRVPRTRLC